MPLMSTRVARYREALDRLDQGASLVIQDVSWEDYEELLEKLDDRPGLRVTYDNGRLEVVSLLPEHEKCKCFIEQMVGTLRDELDLNVEALGSTTWKKKLERKGAEPDACYYVANAEQIIGKSTIDLTTDPPPDLAVEIDSTKQSSTKFSIYAAFGIPEVWRYDVKRSSVDMYGLWEGAYIKISSSLAFPILTAHALADFVNQSRTAGQKAALAAFRQWLKKTRT
jgi:Uma2 family endonuclease